MWSHSWTPVQHWYHWPNWTQCLAWLCPYCCGSFSVLHHAVGKDKKWKGMTTVGERQRGENLGGSVVTHVPAKNINNTTATGLWQTSSDNWLPVHWPVSKVKPGCDANLQSPSRLFSHVVFTLCSHTAPNVVKPPLSRLRCVLAGKLLIWLIKSLDCRLAIGFLVSCYV